MILNLVSVLYNMSLFIYFKYSSIYMLIPDSNLSQDLLSPLVTINLFSTSVSLFLFHKQIHLYHFSFRLHI